MNIKELRAKRIAAGVPAELVAAKAKIERGRLSRIERQIVIASPEEFDRLKTTVEELASTKQRIEEYAASVGWPGTLPL